jgi:hypothetical protein
VALAALGLVVMASPSLTTASAEKVEYEGHMLASRKAKVEFTVLPRAGKPAIVDFRIDDALVVCPDGSFETTDLGSRRFSFADPTHFFGTRYSGQPSGDWSYYEVAGQLHPGRKATGYADYMLNLYDPPESAPTASCDFGNHPYQRWIAHRVRAQ